MTTTLLEPAHTSTAQAAAAAPVWNSSIADPGPLGILAFSTTSFMLGLYNAGIVDPAGAALVVPVALIFGGFIQIIAAIVQLMRGNVFGAAVFGSFGPFWVIYALISNTYAGKVDAAATAAGTDPAAAEASAVTVFLAMFTVLAVIFLIAALRTDAVLVAVLALVVAALVLLAFGHTGGGHESLIHAAGWTTMALGVLGWYHGASHVIEFTFKRSVLPLFPLSDAH